MLQSVLPKVKDSQLIKTTRSDVGNHRAPVNHAGTGGKAAEHHGVAKFTRRASDASVSPAEQRRVLDTAFPRKLTEGMWHAKSASRPETTDKAQYGRSPTHARRPYTAMTLRPH